MMTQADGLERYFEIRLSRNLGMEDVRKRIHVAKAYQASPKECEMYILAMPFTSTNRPRAAYPRKPRYQVRRKADGEFRGRPCRAVRAKWRTRIPHVKITSHRDDRLYREGTIVGQEAR